MRQAPMTAHDYLLSAVHDIDEVLGKGYARAHPELMAAFIQTAALDFGAAVIARAIEGLAEPLRSDHPLQGETLDGLESALNAIADAIADAKEDGTPIAGAKI
jgi:hypothetical protein